MRTRQASAVRIAKSVIFCVGLMILLQAADFVLNPVPWSAVPWPAVAETEHEANVIILGSSRSYASVLPMEMWRHNGITAVNVAGGAQPVAATLSYLQQARRSHEPKVVLLEASLVGLGNGRFGDVAMAHGNFDAMPSGLPKATGILRSVQPTAWPELFLPIQIYHSRWRDIGHDDFDPRKHQREAYAKGSVYLTNATPQSGTVKYTVNSQSAYVRDLTYIRAIAEECARAEARLVLFTSPSWNRTMIDGLPVLAKLKSDLESDFPEVEFIDMDSVAETIDIQPDTDYMDEVHLNHRGAIKLTKWLANYLARDYGIADDRNEEFAPRWNEALRRYDAVFVQGW